MHTTKRPLATPIALLAIATTMVLGSTPASAAITHRYSGGSFGPTGPGSAFVDPANVAVDQATGDVYVLDLGTNKVYKFDSAGHPLDFSAPGLSYVNGNQLTGTPRGPFSFVAEFINAAVTQVAVDTSGGPTDGDIYVATGGSVEVFGANGAWLGSVGGGSCGVAVGPDGVVYTADLSRVDKFIPHANPVISQDLVSESFVGSNGVTYNPCVLAADSLGNVYIQSTRENNIVRSSPAQIAVSTGVVVAVSNLGFGVDPDANDLYVDEGTKIVEFDATGDEVDSFPTFASGSFGLAVTGTGATAGRGELYISDPKNNEVDIYTPEAVPDVSITGPSPLGSTTATLKGTIGAVGGFEANTIEFEYGATASYGSTAVASPSGCAASSGVCTVTATLTNLVPNSTYHYRLQAANINGEHRGGDQTFTTAAALPAISDLSPMVRNLSHTSVLFSATINPEHAPSFYHFVYGTTNSYGSAGPELEAGTGFGDETLGESIEGLQPGTTYHYALVATNKAGTIVGPDETFTTSPLTPPALTTGGASEITQTSARLSGAVDTEGELTSIYGFDLGIDTNYSQGFIVGHTEAGDPSPGQITQLVTGLEPGTTYHYRLFATNTDGTTQSSDGMFTTAGPPNASTVLDILPVPLATPLLSGLPSVAFPSEAKATPVKKTVKAKKKKTSKRKKHKAKKSTRMRKSKR